MMINHDHAARRDRRSTRWSMPSRVTGRTARRRPCPGPRATAPDTSAGGRGLTPVTAAAAAVCYGARYVTPSPAATMHEASYPALTQAITHQLAPLRKSQNATMAGFGAMAKAAMADGACPRSTRS